MLLFMSGSCRLFRPMYLFSKKYNIDILHGIEKYFGTRSLGYLHDTKCHIQFLNLIRGNIELPTDVLPRFFTTYSPIHFPTFKIEEDNHHKIPRLIEDIKKCKIFCFEICSLKITKMTSEIDGKKYIAHSHNYRVKQPVYTQTKDELLEDLDTIVKLCGEDCVIFFQCHFRPQIIFNNDAKKIPNREIIFQALSEFVVGKDNIFLIDPSFNDVDCYNVTNENYDYFTELGHENIENKYETYIDKFYNLPFRNENTLNAPSHPVT